MFIQHFRAGVGAALVAVLTAATMATGPAAAAEGDEILIEERVVTETDEDKTDQAVGEPICVLIVDGVHWGGRFLCNYARPYHRFSNGLLQFFVVGKDYGIWTRWRNPNGTLSPASGWYNLGGQVKRGNPSDPGHGAYILPGIYGTPSTPELFIYGNTSGYVHYFRVRSLSGTWTPWARQG